MDNLDRDLPASPPERHGRAGSTVSGWPSRCHEMPNNLVLSKVRGRIAVLLCLLSALGGGCAILHNNSSRVEMLVEGKGSKVEPGKGRSKPVTPKIRYKSAPVKPIQQPPSEPTETEEEKLRRIYEELPPLQKCMDVGDCFYA